MLNDLAAKYNTDKGLHGHSYTSIYGIYLNSYQDLEVFA